MESLYMAAAQTARESVIVPAERSPHKNVNVEGKRLFMRKQLKFPDNIGMHIRIASLIAVEASRYTSVIKVCYKGSAYNAKSIIGLSSSVIEPGGTFELIAEGDDAEEAMKSIERIVQTGHP